MQKNLPWSARGTGTWQQQPSANGCQVPVPWHCEAYAVASPNSTYYAPLCDA